MRRHSLLISGPLLVLFFFGVSLRDVVRMQSRLLLFEPLLVLFFLGASLRGVIRMRRHLLLFEPESKRRRKRVQRITICSNKKMRVFVLLSYFTL